MTKEDDEKGEETPPRLSVIEEAGERADLEALAETREGWRLLSYEEAEALDWRNLYDETVYEVFEHESGPLVGFVYPGNTRPWRGVPDRESLQNSKFVYTNPESGMNSAEKRWVQS